MAGRRHVNLDAMIPRADFALLEDNAPATEKVQSIGIRDLRPDGLLPLLRKPDFQRETNHWTPDQVVTLIKSFVDKDLIPSVILWKSEGSIFVIDGGHRLSVIRAWLEDDYGDKLVSLPFFEFKINDNQRRAAEETRRIIAREVGSYADWLARGELIAKGKADQMPAVDRERAANLRTRTIPIQWVDGNAERAQQSFFKINKQGTPLDDIESLLISNRKRPGAIAARSIIRSGSGHRYWSSFDADKQQKIVEKSKDLYQLLFEPEIDTPIKTLDLPLGGGAGVRTALKLLVDFVIIASRDQQGKPEGIADQDEDATGDATLRVLDRSLRLAGRITGNGDGSLGLHPAVYFYGPSGSFIGALFMGMSVLIARKLVNNDSGFFVKFTKVRKQLEEYLVAHKQLIATIIQQTRSAKRYDTLAGMFQYLIEAFSAGEVPTEQNLVSQAGVEGRVIIGDEKERATRFSEETKSATYLREALANAMRCPVCGGYLDPKKSVSYDHVTPVREGGKGSESNCQLAHPYCNQSIKH